MLKRFLRALMFPLVALMALILWFEDWLWEPFEHLMRWLGSLPLLRQIEALLRRAPPYAALALFSLPALAILPFKVVGLWLIAVHHVVLGLTVFVAAKVVGTALLAWLVALTKPALMKLGWFAALWDWFMVFKARVFARITGNPAWRWTFDTIQRVRQWLKTS